MSGAFCSPVASLQSKPVFEAVLSLLLVGSARGLLCLPSQVYIFVCRLCTASFYSVLSSARYLLMHAFLSFAASKTADKTRSSSVFIWDGLFETQPNWDALALLCLDHAVSASVSLPSLLHCILAWSWNLCASHQVSFCFLLFVSFRSQARTGPVAVKSLLFSYWHFPAIQSSDAVCNKRQAQSIPKVIQGTGCIAHVVELCGLCPAGAHQLPVFMLELQWQLSPEAVGKYRLPQARLSVRGEKGATACNTP